jgi:lactate racemase
MGHEPRALSRAEADRVVSELVAAESVDDAHVVVLVPDGTRTAPMRLMTELLTSALSGRARRVDFLVALGTHQPMSPEALTGHLGPGVDAVNHEWWIADTFTQVGTVDADEVAEFSAGQLSRDVPVRVNRLAVEADLVIICGPVFPHEVVGFSGGNKYLFPGVSGPEMIDATHWLGALITSREIIGTPGRTPVRQMIDRAASMIPTRRRCLAMVVAPGSGDLIGLYGGSPEEAWQAAAAQSARVHIRYLDHPYPTVLSIMPTHYEDMWTAAKGMYKTEPVVADGGEVVVYAPHISEVSVVHGKLLAEVGYHVRDYFTGQWDRFSAYPGSILAHSTHLRGAGTWSAETGERPRIRVTLATGIDEATCLSIGLGYRDPASIDVAAWARRSDVLVVPNAGETLYRLAPR